MNSYTPRRICASRFRPTSLSLCLIATLTLAAFQCAGIEAVVLENLSTEEVMLEGSGAEDVVLQKNVKPEPVGKASMLMRLGADHRPGSIHLWSQHSQRSQPSTMAVQLQHVASGLYVEDRGGELRLTSDPDENATFVLRHSAPRVASNRPEEYWEYSGNLLTYDGEHYVAFQESGGTDCMGGRIVTNATARNETTSIRINRRNQNRSWQLRNSDEFLPSRAQSLRRMIFSPAWEGTWDTNYGELRLHQRGYNVRGDYESVEVRRGSKIGTFKGRYDPNRKVLSGTFTNSGRVGEMELRLDKNEFHGKWRWYGDEAWIEGWNGTRINPSRPALKAAKPFPGSLTGIHLEGATAYSVHDHCLEDRTSTQERLLRLKVSPLTPSSLVANAEARGPSRRTVNLEQDLELTVPSELQRAHREGFSFFNDVLNMRPEIYMDVNTASGVYYFAPARYYMAWNAEEGFGMGTLYGAGGEAGMYTYLQHGIQLGSAEMELAEQLAELYALENELPFTALRPLPVAGSSAENLADAVRLQDIERIVVKELSGPLDRVRLEWISDALDAQQIKQRMTTTRDGLSGQITLSIGEGELESLPVDAQLDLHDGRTYGKLTYSPFGQRPAGDPGDYRRLTLNGSNFSWTNELPYPVELKFLNVLLSGPQVYSWRLDERIERGDAALIEGAAVIPDWVLEKGFFWVDYSVEACEACDDAVFKSFASALTERKQVNIVLESFGALEALGVRRMTVKVRSRYAGPSTTSEVPRAFGTPVTFNADDEVHKVGPLYVPSIIENAGSLFEYHLTLIMEDGRPLEADTWISVTRLEEGIGRFQACQAFEGALPACEEE